jgi:hypothetical protein
MAYVPYTVAEIAEHASKSKSKLQQHKIMYYDDIAAGDTIQYCGAVLSHFEAICRRIRKDLPHVTEISAQTDNARCYKSPQLLFGLYTVALLNGLRLLRYIHTGVQDGKGAIDGHFATTMRYIVLFCKMGNDVVTPAQIVQALWAYGGVNNCATELVYINRETIENFATTNKVIINHLSPA